MTGYVDGQTRFSWQYLGKALWENRQWAWAQRTSGLGRLTRGRGVSSRIPGGRNEPCREKVRAVWGGKASQGWWGPESEGGEENIEDEEREREEKVAWSELRNHFWMHPVPEAELCLVHDEELSMA